MRVRGLARALRLRDAYSAIADVRRRGVPQGEEVPFEQVINSPMAGGAPLTVVHPHEGCRVSHQALSQLPSLVVAGIQAVMACDVLEIASLNISSLNI